MRAESLCMGCMEEKGSAAVCPNCAWGEGTTPNSHLLLPPRTVLQGKYLLGRVLGQGGFGITYLGWDLTLNRKLAVKEYFRRDVCARGRDRRTVEPFTGGQETFRYGLEKFVEEGQALARFQGHPGIVSILDFLYANGTAYIVMVYMEGMTLAQYLRDQGGKIGYELALNILLPVMDVLREVHRAGMLHRDISPDNIYLNCDRQVCVLDFGSARHGMREQSPSVPALVKPGYAPIEQYSTAGKQGPWTDVYGLAATFYRAITGQTPSEAPNRWNHDDLIPPGRKGVPIPARAEAALLKALAVLPQNRFQTIGELQNVILRSAPEAAVARMGSEEKQRTAPSRPIRFAQSPLQWLLEALVTVAVVVLCVAAWYSSPYAGESHGSSWARPSASSNQLHAPNPRAGSALAVPSPNSSVAGSGVAQNADGGGANPAASGAAGGETIEADLKSRVNVAKQRGDAWLDAGRYDKAIKAYEEGLEADPLNVELRLRIQRARRARAAETAVFGGDH